MEKELLKHIAIRGYWLSSLPLRDRVSAGTYNIYIWLLGDRAQKAYSEEVEWKEWRQAFVLANQAILFRGEIVRLKDLFSVLSVDGMFAELKQNEDLKRKLQWNRGISKIRGMK